MGEVLQRTKVGNKVTIEVSDLYTDVSKYIEKYKSNGIPEENIKILLNDGKHTVAIDVITLSKLKKQLEFLTSDVKDTDCEEEKFTKIILSIIKNIKYAHDKTGDNNVGTTGNLVEGLLLGECVCVGYAWITKAALEMHGIESVTVYSDDHAWNKVKLGGKWYNFDPTNVKAKIFMLRNLGKCLVTDREHAKKYKAERDDIICDSKAPKTLIKDISDYVKKHKKNVPKAQYKTNFITKLLSKFGGLLRESDKYLPEAQPVKESSPEMKGFEIAKYSLVANLKEQKQLIWEIQTWNKEDVHNKIRTVYVGLPSIGDPKFFIEEYGDEFISIYEELLSENPENHIYIGGIEILKDEDGKENIAVCDVSSDKNNISKQIVEKINKERAKTEVKESSEKGPNSNNQKDYEEI